MLPTTLVLPQVGQGAIALRCREDDDATRSALAGIDDPSAHRCVLAERSFLARLGGGCEAPVGALAQVDGDGVVVLEGLVATIDGHVLVRRRIRGADPLATGRALAEAMLADDGAAHVIERASP